MAPGIASVRRILNRRKADEACSSTDTAWYGIGFVVPNRRDSSQNAE